MFNPHCRGNEPRILPAHDALRTNMTRIGSRHGATAHIEIAAEGTGRVDFIKIPGYQVKDAGIAIESFRQLPK